MIVQLKQLMIKLPLHSAFSISIPKDRNDEVKATLKTFATPSQAREHCESRQMPLAGHRTIVMQTMIISGDEDGLLIDARLSDVLFASDLILICMLRDSLIAIARAEYDSHGMFDFARR